MKKYDIAIIGGGISALMAAFRIKEKQPNLNIAIFEKGHKIENRICPIINNNAETCLKCASCAIMEGMAGAGAFSDGKYIISTEYGGWLTDFLEESLVISLIEEADDILMRFGATSERFMPNDNLKTVCLQNDLHMSQAQLKHLGTDENFNTMKKLISHISKYCDIYFDTEIIDVNIDSHIIITKNEDDFYADHIIFAVGRVGSRFFADWCNKNKIPLVNNQVDIGVRVELPYQIWEHFSKEIYEPKIWFRGKKYGDITRMFCFNERGSVVTENTGGVITVNGHSYKNEDKKTKNSNFALLTTMRFTRPFKRPIEYARYIASLANMLSDGSVLVQRFGDLIEGKRTDEKRLRISTTIPTLSAAVPGDLSLCIPKRQLDDIIETLQSLNKIAPGTSNYDTLLYGIECKYYSARPECSDFELKGTNKIYGIGDGAGFTRSLSQAAANGLYIGDKILRQYQ